MVKLRRDADHVFAIPNRLVVWRGTDVHVDALAKWCMSAYLADCGCMC